MGKEGGVRVRIRSREGDGRGDVGWGYRDLGKMVERETGRLGEGR